MTEDQFNRLITDWRVNYYEFLDRGDKRRFLDYNWMLLKNLFPSGIKHKKARPVVQLPIRKNKSRGLYYLRQVFERMFTVLFEGSLKDTDDDRHKSALQALDLLFGLNKRALRHWGRR